MNRRTALTALGALVLTACDRNKTDPKVAAANLATGKAFLAKNASAPGVKVLPEGVQYRVDVQGPGVGDSPRPQDLVKVHYEGKLLDGTVFDSSFERGTPAVFTLDGLVQGWVIALQKMKKGDEWTLWLPPELAYGEEDKGPIPGNSVLAFRIQLVDVARAG